MTKRAKRLAKYLEEYGWTVFDEAKYCKCGNIEYGKEYKFCRLCGNKLLPPKKVKNEALIQLENAIAFALEEQ